MSARNTFRVVLTTCASAAEARRIGRSAVEKKLAACANIVPRIESIYRWKRKVERAGEVLMILKTSGARLKELERHVIGEHNYGVPEFIVLPVAYGSRKYLRWIDECTR